MSNEKTIIEINGVKMEIDLRHATIVHQNIKVGSRVKLLEKGQYSGMNVYAGVVVGFDNFPTLPTIIVSYIKTSYGTASPLNFAYINSKSSEQWEMIPGVDEDLPIVRDKVLNQMDSAIEAAQQNVENLIKQRAFFIANFGAYFADMPTEVHVGT